MGAPPAGLLLPSPLRKRADRVTTGPDPAVLSWACTSQKLPYAWGWLHPHILCILQYLERYREDP